MYNVLIKKKALKNVQKQQPKIQKAFKNWVENELPFDPEKTNDGKLTNTNIVTYKKRFGSFRALYNINEKEILVTIEHFESRGQVYKNL